MSALSPASVTMKGGRRHRRSSKRHSRRRHSRRH
jgi:hypothetical protein